ARTTNRAPHLTVAEFMDFSLPLPPAPQRRTPDPPSRDDVVATRTRQSGVGSNPPRSKKIDPKSGCKELPDLVVRGTKTAAELDINIVPQSQLAPWELSDMKIVLVDDHTLFRVGVRHVLATPPGFEVIGEASTARGAFRIIDATVPDLVLMDIALPGMD